MGTYTDFAIAGYPLLSSKSAVVPEAMTVFRETDKRTYVRKLSDRNPLVGGEIDAVDADDLEHATEYCCETRVAAARLDVMGFTMKRACREFEAGRQAALSTYRDWAKERSGADWTTEKIALLEALPFESYIAALRQVVVEGLRPDPFDDRKKPGLSPAVRHVLDEDDEYAFGFFAHDIRCLIRAACEVAPSPSAVVQDITALVEGGYYSPDERVCQQSIDDLTLGHLENANRIVLTEGSSDAHVLKRSLALLYPHLSGYYSFLDFEGTRAPGSAGQLVSLVKGFAAAGIGNRVVALFDNDSAARDAMRSLKQIQLPPNIRILSYPDIALLRNYPTLGPSGRSDMDINGLAASVELYFGADTLRRPDGSFAPIQWKGYIESLSSYQGEVLGKSELHALFERKLDAAQRTSASRASQDWSGIDAILRSVFQAFANEA